MTGNRDGLAGDYLGVECDDYREALSAQLDSEDPGVDPAAVDTHLSRCSACRDWLRRAGTVTRAARVQPAEEVPDLTEQVLARARREGSAARDGVFGRAVAGVRRVWGLTVARVALVAVAAAQAASGAAAVSGAGVPAVMPLHAARELGAFSLAVAVGFAWAAWRPARARAHLPLLATLVGVLAGFTAVDLLAGRAGLSGEAGHLLLVAGLALTAVLARHHHEPGPPPAESGQASPQTPPRGTPLTAGSARGRADRARRENPGSSQAGQRWVA